MKVSSHDLIHCIESNKNCVACVGSRMGYIAGACPFEAQADAFKAAGAKFKPARISPDSYHGQPERAAIPMKIGFHDNSKKTRGFYALDCFDTAHY